jgi:Putative metal-binding motif
MNRWVAGLALAVAASLVATSPAAARRDGIATESCNGCHLGGQEPAVRLLASPMHPSVGQIVSITLEIDAVNGSVGGFYLKLEGAGSLQAAAGSGIRSFDASSLGHSAPKMASGGVVRFGFNYTAPATPGGVVFRAFAVSGNGDNTSRGDGAGEAQLLLAAGCTGQLYTVDYDGDGYGAVEYGQKLDCSPPDGYAARDGDCQEYAPEIHPGATELCNHKDEDCDGKLDEGLPIGPQYADKDGDGYGAGTESIMDCSSPKGYAADAHDCNDNVASTHPKADEVCNFVDDDCDGRTDEGVRPSCGVGWCRRLADSCTGSVCTPGKPRAEECNAFDDDCDDVLDEDVTCPGGARCIEGRCGVPGDAAPSSDAGSEGAAEAGAEPAAAAGSGSQAHASAECATDAQVKKPGCEDAATPSSSDAGGCGVARPGRESGAALLVCAYALLRAGVRRSRKRKRRGS